MQNINKIKENNMYKFLIAISLALFLTSCSSSVSMNSESECEPKWYGMKKTFFWQKSYISDNDQLYGRGFERAFDRTTARTSAEALARRDVLNQLTLKFDGEFERQTSEMQKKGTKNF